MSKTKYLSRTDVLEADDLGTEEIDVPEWGGTLRVRGLTGKEGDDYQVGLLAEPGQSAKMKTDNMTAKLVSLCVIDEQGRPFFKEGDVLRLGKKSGAALNRVYAVAARLSGLGDEKVKELRENFGGGQNGDSTSA